MSGADSETKSKYDNDRTSSPSADVDLRSYVPSRTHAELEEMFFMFRDVFQPGEIPWHEGSLI